MQRLCTVFLFDHNPSSQLIIIHQRLLVSEKSSPSPPPATSFYTSRSESVAPLAVRSVGRISDVRTTDDDEEEDNLDQEPSPAAAGLLLAEWRSSLGALTLAASGSRAVGSSAIEVLGID